MHILIHEKIGIRLSKLVFLFPCCLTLGMATLLYFYKSGSLVSSLALSSVKNSDRVLFVRKIRLNIEIFKIGGFYGNS